MLQTPAGFDFPLVTSMTAFTALPLKFIIDTIKGAIPQIPGPMLPAVGFIIGYAQCIVVLMAAERPFSKAILAQCAIAAVGAQIAAGAATWNQTRVDKVDEKIQAALDKDPKAGTSVADIKASVDNQTS